jgi:hypothetical protein
VAGTVSSEDDRFETVGIIAKLADLPNVFYRLVLR